MFVPIFTQGSQPVSPSCFHIQFGDRCRGLKHLKRYLNKVILYGGLANKSLVLLTHPVVVKNVLIEKSDEIKSRKFTFLHEVIVKIVVVPVSICALAYFLVIQRLVGVHVPKLGFFTGGQTLTLLVQVRVVPHDHVKTHFTHKITNQSVFNQRRVTVRRTLAGFKRKSQGTFIQACFLGVHFEELQTYNLIVELAITYFCVMTPDGLCGHHL